MNLRINSLLAHDRNLHHHRDKPADFSLLALTSISPWVKIAASHRRIGLLMDWHPYQGGFGAFLHRKHRGGR